MTLTETRPDPAAAGAPSAAVGQRDPLATADHKRLGRYYIAGSLLFLVVGGVLGVLLRADLSESAELLGDDYFRVFSLHATLTPLLFLAPLWVGLGTYLVPLQIGAARLALPRLHAFAMWLHFTGGLLLVAAYVVGPPNGFGISTAIPMTAPPGGANAATNLWITSLFVIGLAAVLAGLDLAVTVLTMRTRGLTLARVPFFSWATFLTSVVTILATPVFLAGLAILWLDQRYGGEFFAQVNGPAQDIWQHLLWLLGRPEVYLLTLPGLGAACDIVGTHARRPLLNVNAAQGLLGAFAVLSLGAWAAGSEVRDAIVLPTYSPLTALVAVPVALLALLWLGTLVKGTLRFDLSLAFVAGALGLAVFAGVNAAVAGVAGVDGSAWGTAQLHMVAFAVPALLAFAALYHWAPKLWGAALSPGLGAAVLLASFGGFFLNGLGTYLLGYEGAPFHVKAYETSVQANYSRLASAGGLLVALGVVLLVVDVFRATSAGRRAAAAPADPYGGLTLEWATASPPPPHNFDAVPEVRSSTPLADLAAGASGGGAP